MEIYWIFLSWAKLWLEKTMPEISSVEVAQIVVLCAIAEDTWDVQVKYLANVDRWCLFGFTKSVLSYNGNGFESGFPFNE